jgi:hypothetical protein
MKTKRAESARKSIARMFADTASCGIGGAWQKREEKQENRRLVRRL